MNFLFSRQKAFQRIAESEDGKKLLAEIYAFCECKDPIVPNDPLSTGRNIGKELVAKHIRKILDQDTKAVEDLIKKQATEIAEYKTKLMSRR